MPSRHLLLEEASASNATSLAEIGSAPNALIESTSRRRPCRATMSAISAIGFRMPLVVSQ